MRRRLDTDLVRRGLVASRVEARSLIDQHLVLVAGSVAHKASRLVGADEPVVILSPPRRFVSRGGDKLEHALEIFSIEVVGRRCLDIGASTGGFTDCLLHRGAGEVVALDVGHGQLDSRLRHDPRVRVHERFNARQLSREAIGGPVDIVVCDVAFISLELLLDPLLSVCSPGATVVLLVKPQFEAGRRDVARGRGVISDPQIWQAVVERISGLLDERGCTVLGTTESPLLGSKGNREFLVAARVPRADQR